MRFEAHAEAGGVEVLEPKAIEVRMEAICSIPHAEVEGVEALETKAIEVRTRQCAPEPMLRLEA